MIKTCAWCKKSLGEVTPMADKRETHGICLDCARKLTGKKRQIVKREFTDPLFWGEGK